MFSWYFIFYLNFAIGVQIEHNGKIFIKFPLNEIDHSVIRKRSLEGKFHQDVTYEVDSTIKHSITINCSSSDREIYILDTFWGIYKERNATRAYYERGDCTSHDTRMTSHCTGRDVCTVNVTSPGPLSCYSGWPRGIAGVEYLQIEYYCIKSEGKIKANL